VFDFLSGRMGGRQRYVEKHGHSMLRRRHFPYAIGPEERNQRLLCMRMALEQTVADAALQTALYAQFAQLGEHMRNRGADVHSCGHAPVDGRSSRNGPIAA